MKYSESKHSNDDDFTVSNIAVHNNQGHVTIFVDKDGSKYTVVGNSFLKTFSSIDSDNKRFD